MANKIHVRAFHEPLMAAGLVPPNCKLMDLRIGVDGAVTVTYEVYFDTDQLERLGAILIDVVRAEKSRGLGATNGRAG